MLISKMVQFRGVTPFTENSKVYRKFGQLKQVAGLNNTVITYLDSAVYVCKTPNDWTYNSILNLYTDLPSVITYTYSWIRYES